MGIMLESWKPWVLKNFCESALILSVSRVIRINFLSLANFRTCSNILLPYPWSRWLGWMIKSSSRMTMPPTAVEIVKSRFTMPMMQWSFLRMKILPRLGASRMSLSPFSWLLRIGVKSPWVSSNSITSSVISLRSSIVAVSIRGLSLVDDCFDIM